jgi:hypothetical protein
MEVGAKEIWISAQAKIQAYLFEYNKSNKLHTVLKLFKPQINVWAIICIKQVIHKKVPWKFHTFKCQWQEVGPNNPINLNERTMSIFSHSPHEWLVHTLTSALLLCKWILLEVAQIYKFRLADGLLITHLFLFLRQTWQTVELVPLLWQPYITVNYFTFHWISLLLRIKM